MDLLGNRESVTIDGGTPETYAVDVDTNRYDADGTYTVTLAYDDAGNTTTDNDGYVYTYDYENRVETITRPSDSTIIVTYTYDALGRRIRMVDEITAANSRWYYYSDGWQVLEEYDTDATPTRKAYYVWGNYIDELLFIWNSQYQYAGQVLSDHLHSPTAILNISDGSILERYEYNAYGKATVYTDDGADNTWLTSDDSTQSYSAKGNPYLFTGRRLDTLDTGNYEIMYYRNR
ncbi:MAG: hypothetical protein KAS23_14055, partial [Anaerohalosphaera sp.]|nr:hypothetical protein [Anaerohalosphaera sp.]